MVAISSSGAARIDGAGTSTIRNAEAASTKSSYVVRVGKPGVVSVANSSIGELTSRAHATTVDALGRVLAELARTDDAGPATYDAALDAYRVDLTDRGRQRLVGDPLVASVDPTGTARPASAAAANAPLPPTAMRGAQNVGSVNFVQVYTPFMWGRTNFGGLGVTITLENSGGTVKGVSAQSLLAPPNNYVKVDHNQLYYETIFKDPNDPLHPVVNILPGDRVHVVTTGVDPSTGLNATEDKRIVVDDVRAWTSYDNDSVSGLAPAGAQMTVSLDNFLWIADYVTPGNLLTYADTTADSSGRFSVGQFRTSADPTPRKVDLLPGSTGYVRVKHSDGNEIYTVHGQDTFVLENSYTVHGYAFPLPTAPSGLDQGVVVDRVGLTLTVSVAAPGGALKGTVTSTGGSFDPWVITLDQVVKGGDTVSVNVGSIPTQSIAVSPIDARVDVGSGQILGTGPANTSMTVQAGRISGYLSADSFYDFIVNHVTTDGGGVFASGSFACGSGALRLGPGSFGYAGFEDGQGHFIYEAVAAPTTEVMADFPYVEGWLPDGAERPTLAVVDSSGAIKHSSTVTPTLLWLSGQKLFLNVFFDVVTDQFINPGDVVTLSGLPTGKATVPVDKLTGYVDVDGDNIFGDAPAGASLRIIPRGDRSAYHLATADGSNRFTADNRYRNFIGFNCTEVDKTEDFVAASSGRVYYWHADGNAVFAHFGRAMWVNQNDRTIEVWAFILRDLDWWPFPPQRQMTVTLTPRDGSAATTLSGSTDFTGSGHVRIDLSDASNQPIVVRAGDTVSATFDEGPAGHTRSVTLAVQNQPRVLAVPDVDTSTVAGVGPSGWPGGTTLSGVIPYLTALPPRALTAWGPVNFLDVAKKPLPLARGYSGTAAFTSPTGIRVWSAWAVVALPTKIVGYLNVGDTKVCGTAAPNAPLRIHDLSSPTADVILATGTVGADGKFCATTAPLAKDQVVLAEADGTYSQPVVVGSLKHTFVSFVARTSTSGL